MPDTERLLRLLLESDAEFILVGGFAAVVHGSSVVTQDLDLCFPFNRENLHRLQDGLKDLHLRYRAGSKEWDFLEKDIERFAQYENLYLMTDLGKLDLLGQIKALGSYRDLEGHTMDISLFGKRCRVLDLDSLIKAKEAMDRPKDREVVLQLKAIREKLGLD